MKISIFTICEAPPSDFQTALSNFFFPAYIKILLTGKKIKRLYWPFCGFFSYCFFKTQ